MVTKQIIYKSCSYCGAKYNKSDDKAIEDGWARFELSSGNSDHYDSKIRVSCSNPNCRELMRDEMFEALGPRNKILAPL